MLLGVWMSPLCTVSPVVLSNQPHETAGTPLPSKLPKPSWLPVSFQNPTLVPRTVDQQLIEGCPPVWVFCDMMRPRFVEVMVAAEKLPTADMAPLEVTLLPLMTLPVIVATEL